MKHKNRKHHTIQLIKHDFDNKIFNENYIEYWIDKFTYWHKEIGRGAYVMEPEGSGFCPLVPMRHAKSGLIVSGSWSFFMDNISPLHKKILEHYPIDRYGIFFDSSFFSPTITYFLELLPGLPDDLEIKDSWYNSSEFIQSIESMKQLMLK